MRGITRPCRHGLGPDLHQRWRSHLCGLCLTLRAESGQASRVLTGYDLLVLSVLVEAQTGPAATVTAGPCALRAMRPAEVIPADNSGARLAAAASLLAGAAALRDKITDADIPAPLRPPAARRAGRIEQKGRRLARESGLAPGLLSDAVIRAAEVEGLPRATLDELLEPSGAAVAELFARTADAAGLPANREPLMRAGDAFGRLVHLIDAVDDYRRDQRRGSFNPLAATSTPPAEARRLAELLVRSVGTALDGADLADPDLARALLGPVLERAVDRTFRGLAGTGPAVPRGDDHRRRRPALAGAAAGLAAMAVPAVLSLGIFGGRRRPRAVTTTRTARRPGTAATGVTGAGAPAASTCWRATAAPTWPATTAAAEAATTAASAAAERATP
ncbi:MAG TPA: DUF5685 family protein [Acidimicrobiales bacterium]|nr:DUF5685 family protein [Acidimicrobiales bacterium]